MQVAILGGTGDLGAGLALRLAGDGAHDVVIGSRDAERGAQAAAEYRERLAGSDRDGDASVEGRTNPDAAAGADVVVAAVPAPHLDPVVASVADELDGDAVLVSPVVGLAFDEAGARYEPPESAGFEDAGSYVEVARDAAPEAVPVVGAFHTVSQRRLRALDRPLSMDTVVVGADPAARELVADLATDVRGLDAVDAGPLENAAAVERLAPLAITLGRYNEGQDLGVRFE